MNTNQTEAGNVLAQSPVRHFRGRWLWTFSLEADEWYGCCKRLDDVVEDAFRQARCEGIDPGTPIYFAHGRPAYKHECDEMGVEWPWYQVEPSEAFAVLLPNDERSHGR
jgi:hypothetical protein